MTGMPALLWTASQMYNKGYLPDGDIESLVEILPLIFDNADYKNISPSSRESVSISLLRAACVSLGASILKKKQDANRELLRMLDEARLDALPEVRFAEATSS